MEKSPFNKRGESSYHTIANCDGNFSGNMRVLCVIQYPNGNSIKVIVCFFPWMWASEHANTCVLRRGRDSVCV